MVIGGGNLIATGVGGPAGMMLISAGADTIIQKATTGHVNWGEVAVSGLAGGIGGASIAARTGLTGIKAAMATGAVSGAGGGALTSAYGYVSGPGPHTVTGFLESTAVGAGEGGLLGGAGGAAGHGLVRLGGKVLDHVMPAVETPYGPARQELSIAALRARSAVNGGAPVYRTGTLGHSQAAEGQFWALEHPSTPGYPAHYGIPEENVVNADFTEQGRVPSGGHFITRSAPGIGDNPGGGIEVVTPAHGVDLDWFSTTGPKG